MLFAAFGITGDLMRLKVLPALHALHAQDALPQKVQIVGISRRAWGDVELRDYVRQVIPKSDDAFLERFTFLQGDADSLTTFRTLAERAAGIDLLVYLALAPTLYRTAVSSLRDANFSARLGHTRILLEKPFGTSGSEASALYAQLESVVTPADIYLVDHYLSKEWVRELASLPVPQADIHEVHLRFLETTGVGHRGSVYDALGALRDVVQNHLLQMLAHIVAPALRSDVLELLPELTPAQVATQTIRAQYAGYRNITGVTPGSQTETYCRIETRIAVPSWQDVAITLEAGKCAAANVKEVVFVLKDGSRMTVAERPNIVGEYETLLLAAFAGDHTLFPSMREVRAQWRFVDPILDTWRHGEPALKVF